MIKMQEILEMSRVSDDYDNISISDSHRQELDKRLDRYLKGETTFVSWESIKEDLNRLNN